MKHLTLMGLLALLILAGCGSDESSTDDLAPAQPRWVPRTDDQIYPQAGIRAEPVTNENLYWVRLEWYANSEPDVQRYRIWRLQEFAPEIRLRYPIKDLQIGVDLDAGQSIYSWVDIGDSTLNTPLNMLAPDPTSGNTRGYYWWVQAIDESDNRSELSETAYYRLLNIPYDLQVGRLGENVYRLSWRCQFNPDMRPSYYMIRVYSAFWGQDSVVWYDQVQRYTSAEFVDMEFAASSPLVTDCTYVCQLNAIANLRGSHADSLSGSAAATTCIYRD
ncbi:MAG: hypothetical protein PHI18_01655 [bacterium]|nr:hypothetical protein [bacterium]